MVKLFSDKFKEQYKDILLADMPRRLGLSESSVHFYPFITSRWFQDVRKIFCDTPSQLKFLKDTFQPIYDSGTDWYEKVYNVATVVNARIKYTSDLNLKHQLEFMDSPYNAYMAEAGDCEEYASLMVQIFRLCGMSEYEVFMSVQRMYHYDGTKGEMHATCLVLNPEDQLFYPIEGSWYPDINLADWKKKNPTPYFLNELYGTNDWMTNDKRTYTRWGWPKLII